MSGWLGVRVSHGVLFDSVAQSDQSTNFLNSGSEVQALSESLCFLRVMPTEGARAHNPRVTHMVQIHGPLLRSDVCRIGVTRV